VDNLSAVDVESILGSLPLYQGVVYVNACFKNALAELVHGLLLLGFRFPEISFEVPFVEYRLKKACGNIRKDVCRIHAYT
jgi:hypothetical protein